jgi:hypothetical protein
MKTLIPLIFLLLVNARGIAQSFEAQQLLLDVEKLAQLKDILKDLQDGYKILDAGYSAIRDISKGSFDLHKAFLDGLLAVNPAIRSYKRVADIIGMQAKLVTNYKTAWGRFQQDKHLTPAELALLGTVYGRLFDQSLKDLDVLISLLTDGALRASDAERLQEIDGIYGGMVQKTIFLDRLNSSTAILSQQRASDQNDYQMLKSLYGINP